MWTATLSKCTDGEVWIVKNPYTSWGYTPFETEAEAQAFADEMNAEDERRAEHQARGYETFRNELGEEGKLMYEELLKFEVDGFLASRGMTLADVEIEDGRWKH